MVSQDNRLLPLPPGERGLDRPLSDLAQSKPYGVASEPTHLRDYLQVVLKRKWLILTLVVVVTSLVTIQMYRQPSIYEGVTEIQIENQKSSVLRTGREIVINTGNEQDPAYWNTQLKLLENPALARQVVLTLDLHKDPNFFGAPGQTSIMSSLRRLFSGEDQAPALAPQTEQKIGLVTSEEVTADRMSAKDLARLQPYEDTLAANLTVEPVTGTNLIKLHYTHTNPELAKRIADTFGDVFVQNNADRQTLGREKAERVLADKIAELQHNIDVQEKEKFEFQRAKGIPFAGTAAQGANGVDLTAKRLAKLSEQLLDAENDRKNLEALYNSANTSASPNEIPEVGENKRIQTLREKLDTLKQRRDDLLVIYTSEWPEVKRVDAQIKMLEESLTKAPREVVAAMKSRYKSAVEKEQSLRRSYESERSKFSGENEAQLQLGVLNQKIETNKQYLQTLLQRYNELQNIQSDATRANNVSVVQYSRVPAGPIGPARGRNIVIAFLLSLGVGIGLAFLLDYLDDTLKSVEDVDRHIHLPALALIPASRSERSLLKGKGPAPAEANEATALALIDDVRSPIAEAYRHLRTSLLLSSAGQPPKTILVTSSQPSEGKTTTVVNTAVMLAQTGADVLIIDCDLRRPRLHAHFSVANQRGVTNYLSGESDLDALLQTYDKLPNLKLLTSGPVPPNPAELLGSDEMRKLLTLVGERFTHIIIDSPPAISFTDASILSTMVDGVMLVVHGGRSSRAVVRRAKQQLLDVGANIFGIVLNNVKLEATNYYYYAGYYSSYYTDEENDSGASASARGAG
ncbi:MAG TPA: polysaccharide biosynthesis tyrosine autokinase [Pyrinomonadaceae bacterium]